VDFFARVPEEDLEGLNIEELSDAITAAFPLVVSNIEHVSSLKLLARIFGVELPLKFKQPLLDALRHAEGANWSLEVAGAYSDLYDLFV
jgi:hypothetical protein